MPRKIHFTFACGDYEIARPLRDGRVQPDGIELTVLSEASSRDRTWRIDRASEVDICEFNVCGYFMARASDHPFIALPVFLHRRFRHGFIFVNTKKGIKSPKDLIGKRVGSAHTFPPANNVWMRGILEEHYGAPVRSMTHVVDNFDDVPFEPAPDMNIEVNRSGKPMEQMLLDGDLDALYAPSTPEEFLRGDPRIGRLFADPKAEEISYFKKTGIFPIMHATLIRQDIVEKYPWVPTILTRAFEDAKRMAYGRVSNPRTVPLAFWVDAWEEQNRLMGPDPWRYGMDDYNKKSLGAALRYTQGQGLTKKNLGVEEQFCKVDETTLRQRFGYGA